VKAGDVEHAASKRTIDCDARRESAVIVQNQKSKPRREAGVVYQSTKSL
jgi:hypothetical protein